MERPTPARSAWDEPAQPETEVVAAHHDPVEVEPLQEGDGSSREDCCTRLRQALACCCQVLWDRVLDAAIDVLLEFLAHWFGSLRYHIRNLDLDEDEGASLVKTVGIKVNSKKHMTSSKGDFEHTDRKDRRKNWTNNFYSVSKSFPVNPKAKKQRFDSWGGPPKPRRKRDEGLWHLGPFATAFGHEIADDEDVPEGENEVPEVHLGPRQNFPLFTVIQVIIVFFMWLILSAKSKQTQGGLDTLLPGKTDLVIQWDCVDYRAEIWRWFTYQYTHTGFAHAFSNCLLMLLLGVSLEGYNGTRTFFLMFQVGVLSGVFGVMIGDIHKRVVGMSGGCYSLLGMEFGDVALNFRDDPFAGYKFIFLCLMVACDVWQGAATPTPAGGAPSFAAHIGGGLGGFFLYVLMGHNAKVEVWEKWAKRLTVPLALILVIACLCRGLAYWPPNDIQDPVRWCWARQVMNETIFGDSNYHCVRCSDQTCIGNWSSQLLIGDYSPTACKGNWYKP